MLNIQDVFNKDEILCKTYCKIEGLFFSNLKISMINRDMNKKTLKRFSKDFYNYSLNTEKNCEEFFKKNLFMQNENWLSLTMSSCDIYIYTVFVFKEIVAS